MGWFGQNSWKEWKVYARKPSHILINEGILHEIVVKHPVLSSSSFLFVDFAPVIFENPIAICLFVVIKVLLLPLCRHCAKEDKAFSGSNNVGKVIMSSSYLVCRLLNFSNDCI